MDWDKRQEVLKGKFGELIIKRHLEEQGRVIYIPEPGKPHPFDFLSFQGKEKPEIIEVKSKARMQKWRATGVNRRNLIDYWRRLEENKIDTFIYFVDEHPQEKRIYGNHISKLVKPYTDSQGYNYPMKKRFKGVEVVLFSLECMQHIGDLDDVVCQELIKKSTRSYKY